MARAMTGFSRDVGREQSSLSPKIPKFSGKGGLKECGCINTALWSSRKSSDPQRYRVS